MEDVVEQEKRGAGGYGAGGRKRTDMRFEPRGILRHHNLLP